MDYGETDLEAVEAELIAAERRRAWMAATVSALKAKNCVTQFAERQEAQFSAKVAAMKEIRARLEQAVRADRPATNP